MKLIKSTDGTTSGDDMDTTIAAEDGAKLFLTYENDPEFRNVAEYGRAELTKHVLQTLAARRREATGSREGLRGTSVSDPEPLNRPARAALVRLLLEHLARSASTAAVVIADDHRQSRTGALPADQRTGLELAEEARGLIAAERIIARGDRRLRRLTAAGHRFTQRALHLVESAAATDDQVVMLDGRATTVAGARRLTSELAARVDRRNEATRQVSRENRRLCIIAYGLLLVMLMIGSVLNADWSRPELFSLITATAISSLGTATQVVLGTQVGRQLWAWRHSDKPQNNDEQQDRRELRMRSITVLLSGALLTVMSTLIAGAMFIWVQGKSVGADGTTLVLGLVLATSALAAPWCLVAGEAYDSSPAERRLGAVARILHRAEHGRRRYLRRAQRLLRAADRRCAQADRLLAATMHRTRIEYLASYRVILTARGLAGATTTYSREDLKTSSTDPTEVQSLLSTVDPQRLSQPVELLNERVNAVQQVLRRVLERHDSRGVVEAQDHPGAERGLPERAPVDDGTRPRSRVVLVSDRWILDQPLLDADRGGCGVVYIARDGREPDSSDLFVVKLLRGYKDTAKRRRAHRQLQNEQLWAGRVKSLFVAPIVDAGTDIQFGPFRVTPYYHSTVARTLRKQDFTPTLEWALRVTEQVLRGLVDCYNKAGVIHLDIKPANIALDEFGDVHLLDFGLARVLAATANTPTGPPEGTRWYASPEQLRGKDRHWPTSACDVRAVFAVLYEIVTGWPPLYREAVEQGLIDPDTGAEVPERASELWALLLSGRPIEPVELIPKLPQPVNDLVMKGLDPEPQRRAPGPSSFDAQNALDALTAVQAKVRRWDAMVLQKSEGAPLMGVMTATTPSVLLPGHTRASRVDLDAPDNEAPADEMPDVFRGVELAAAPAERPSGEPWKAAWDEPSETLEGEGRSQSFLLPAEGRMERSKLAEDHLCPSPARPDFDGFFIEHWDRLLSEARRLCAGDQALAEDVVQEAFLQAYRYREELFKASHPYRWLRVVALNAARSVFRREGRRQERERELHALSPDEASDEVSEMLLLDLIDRLPDPERQIIRYRLVLGYERKRIAEITNISLRAIDYHIHRRVFDLPEIATDTQKSPSASSDSAQRSIADLKRRLTDLKLEALLRGYGIELESTGAVHHIDAIVAEAVVSVEQRQHERDGHQPSREANVDSASGRATRSSAEWRPTPSRP